MSIKGSLNWWQHVCLLFCLGGFQVKMSGCRSLGLGWKDEALVCAASWGWEVSLFVKQTLTSSGAEDQLCRALGNGLWTAYGKVRVLQGGGGPGLCVPDGPQFPHPYPSLSLGLWQVTEVQYHGQTIIPKPLLIFTWALKLLGSTFDSPPHCSKGEAQSCLWALASCLRGACSLAWAGQLGRLPKGLRWAGVLSPVYRKQRTLAPPGACQDPGKAAQKSCVCYKLSTVAILRC